MRTENINIKGVQESEYAPARPNPEQRRGNGQEMRNPENIDGSCPENIDHVENKDLECMECTVDEPRRQVQKHNLVSREGKAREVRKRCLPCYELLKTSEGTVVDRKKCKRVTTYCKDCPEEPSMCLSCFNNRH
ncbi:hypothetical protein J6590_075401 [Homalodisca vitripennis]|nr:hypothetical protein J6590_075401 [Homalodisca vitripennis]